MHPLTPASLLWAQVSQVSHLQRNLPPLVLEQLLKDSDILFSSYPDGQLGGSGIGCGLVLFDAKHKADVLLVLVVK